MKNAGTISQSIVIMSLSGCLRVLLLILILAGLEAVTVVHHHPDNEYVLDHEVTYESAVAEARKLQLFHGKIPGCKPCTTDEMTYCTDESVIHDHCCCDADYSRVFLFVPHTCHVGPETCTVRAGDCAEYTRLRECCCHSYYASMWKYIAGDGTRLETSLGTILLLTVLRWLV